MGQVLNGQQQLNNTVITTDTLIFSIQTEITNDKRRKNKKNLQVLLIKRKNDPFKDYWALPGGLFESNATVLENAKREIQEETNIHDIYLEQLYTWGDPMIKDGQLVPRDPREKVVSISHLALIKKDDQNIKAQHDAVDARWFTIHRQINDVKTFENPEDHTHVLEKSIQYTLINDEQEQIKYDLIKKIRRTEAAEERLYELSSYANEQNLAFDHARILDYGLERLSNKLDYTPIIFNLMPTKFTLSNLQLVYETIKNKTTHKASFRRKIKSMVEATGEFEQNTQRRPAKYYRYKFDWKSWE